MKSLAPTNVPFALVYPKAPVPDIQIVEAKKFVVHSSNCM
jgi:hypothetical protein